jgi:hypothetical protein
MFLYYNVQDLELFLNLMGYDWLSAIFTYSVCFNLEVVPSNWLWDSFDLEVVASSWYWDSFNLAFTLFNRQKYCDWLCQFVGFNWLCQFVCFNWYLNSFKILIIFFSIEHHDRSISFCSFWLDYLCDSRL